MTEIEVQCHPEFFYISDQTFAKWQATRREVSDEEFLLELLELYKDKHKHD